MSLDGRNLSLLVGRFLIVLAFVPIGLARLADVSRLAEEFAYGGLPFADVVATFCVLAAIFAPLAILLGLASRIAAGILAVSVVITAATLHRFWNFSGLAHQAEQALFWAHCGLLAGLLFFIASGPGDWTLRLWLTAIGEAFGGRRPAPRAKERGRAPRQGQRKPRAARPPAAQ